MAIKVRQKPVRKATLKAGPNTALPAKRKTAHPVCKVHGVEMIYQPGELRWRCEYSTCKVSVYPKPDTDGGAPIVGRGRLEVLEVTDNRGKTHIYLRCAENNVMIPITDEARGLTHMDEQGHAQLRITVESVIKVNG